MRILLLLILIQYAYADDLESRTMLSNDVAIVFLNDSNTSIVTGLSEFTSGNILRSHYPEKNIIYLKPSQIDACKKLTDEESFRCEDVEGCRPEEKNLVIKNLNEQGCPDFSKMISAFEKGNNIDVYAGVHGGMISDLTGLLQKFVIRPEIQKKFRLFYSMGCSDSKKYSSLDGKEEDSIYSQRVLKAGFATFLGHDGYALSPLTFNTMMTKFKLGKNVGQVHAEMNAWISKSVLSSGTQMSFYGDGQTSIKKRVSLKSDSKWCVTAYGIKTMSEMWAKGCVSIEMFVDYLNRYASLIDSGFCKNTFSKESSVLIWQSLCSTMDGNISDKDLKYGSDFFGNTIQELSHELRCSDLKLISKTLFCYSHKIDEYRKKLGDKKSSKSLIVGDYLERFSDSQFNKNKINQIKELMEKLGPEDCYSK